MEKEFEKSVFYKAMMTGVFTGIFCTLLTMVYDLVFVEYLKFPLSAIINVASLIFFVNLVFLLVGIFYYWFITSFRKGDIIYALTFLFLTVFFVWKSVGVNRTDDHAVNIQFRELLSGIVIIMGLLAALVVPVLYHNKKFDKYVL